MTRPIMDERPIDEINPDWIDAAVEVVTDDGSSVGFRLARYEKTTRDDAPLWILFSTEQPWRIEVGAGAIVRRAPKSAVRQPSDGGFGSDPIAPPAPVTAPAAAAPLSPGSWIVAPPTEPR